MSSVETTQPEPRGSRHGPATGGEGTLNLAPSQTEARRAAAAARALFDVGDFAAARAEYSRAFALGDGSSETIAALQQLLADAGEHETLARTLGVYLDRAGPELSAHERVDWAAARFDAAALAGWSDTALAEAAMRLLEEAATAGGTGWEPLLEPARRTAIMTAFPSPLASLERLEQEAYAPAETGLPTLAIAQAEEIGLRHAADQAIARAVERLLHALGHRDAAYRVEGARRAAAARGSDPSPSPALLPSPPDLRALVVVLAGGHPALRSAAGADLARSGVAATRHVPSAWEATRSGRSVRDVLSGADVAVLIQRRLAHSTADQVRAAAAAIGVAVVAAPTASVSAIRRAVEAFAARKR